MSPPTDHRRAGVIYALLAFGSWGVVPLFWKGFGSIPAAEIIAHRLVWSVIFVGLLVLVRRELSECWRIVRNPRLLAFLLTTAAVLSVNWVIFVHAVNTNHIVEASLGYFINPLFNVLLGAVVLRERLRSWQWMAFALAAAGVVVYGWGLAHLPWMAIGLAVSFGIYGLLRKLVPVPPVSGLMIETLVMTPVALAWLAVVASRGQSHFVDSPGITVLFLCSGIITAFPLMWFISAAKLLPLSTMGFLQYLAPSMQLLMGILVYREPFTIQQGVSFGLIWTAIAVFLSTGRRTAPALADEPAVQ